jgi:alginate O-acetyltransferase complex protein AlgI
MLLGGLWHGASWNFLLWGGVHGALLALERICRGWLPTPPKIARQALIFLAVTAVWVPFKFEAFSETLLWWGAMFGGAGLGSVGLVEIGASALLLLLVWIPRRIYDWDLRFDLPQIAYAGALFITAIWIGYGRVEVSPFLYFRF